MKILFIDLDGTAREPISGDKFPDNPTDQRLIEGVSEAIAYYFSREWRIIGITNQGGVAAGHKSLEDAIAEQGVTLDLIPELKAIYFCPDYEGNICWKITNLEEIEYNDNRDPYYGTYRKPGDGMLQLALSEFAPDGIDECWMIGDREEDALAAAAAGINFMWADVWRNRFMKGLRTTDLTNRHMSRETLLKFLAT